MAGIARGCVVAVVAVSALRQRIAAVVEGLATPGPWHESRWNFQDFPRDPGTYAHLSFAVGTPIWRFNSIMESFRAKRGALGGLVDTEFVVRWTYRIRADRQVADLDAALDAEAVLVTALAGVAMTDAHIGISQARRSVVGDGTWMLGEVSLLVQHRIAIQ